MSTPQLRREQQLAADLAAAGAAESAGVTAVANAAVLRPGALLAGGIAVGIITGRPVLSAGLRQLALDTAAVAVTYGVGHLLGATVA